MNAFRVGTVAVFLAIVLFALPPLLSLYWMGVLTDTAVYAIVALGLGILMGRVGLVSLGQIAILAIGSWIAARFLYGTGIPFPLVLLICGLLTAVIGTLVGLPALRLSGLYLALITLMLAGAITVVLTTTNFPNGGGGFLGHTETDLGNAGIRRPAIGQSDAGYFRYTVVVALALFMLAFWHLRSKPGRAWAAIRQSEPSALAAGVNITRYKLWALFLASFITGVGGGLLAGSVNKLYTYQFPTSQSIVLLAVALMGGIYNLWGAVIAGFLMKTLPALLDLWGAPADLLTILFGIGVLQVLVTAPAGLAVQFPKDMRSLGRLLLRGFRRLTPARGAAS